MEYNSLDPKKKSMEINNNSNNGNESDDVINAKNEEFIDTENEGSDSFSGIKEEGIENTKREEIESQSEDLKTTGNIKNKSFGKKNVNCCSKKWLGFVCIGFIIIAIVIFSMVFQFRDNNGNGDLPNGTTQNSTLLYNNFTFHKELIGWSTLIKVGDNVYDLRMKYNPAEVDYFEIDNQSKIVDRLLNSDLVLITMDPFIESEVALAGLEIAKIMNPRKEDTGILGIPTIIGVTYIPDGYQNKEVLVFDCNNATEQSEFDKITEVIGAKGDIKIELNNPKVSVIKYEVNEGVNKIFMDDNCIKIYGTNSSNVYKQANMLTYAILNIIPSKDLIDIDLIEPYIGSDTEIEIPFEIKNETDANGYQEI